jgi:catechol 2,3-dioxygenase-like lactoylglutathione lyase family enzyme
MTLNQKERNSAPSEGTAPEGGFATMVPELDVTDLEASLGFWCGLLGFSVAYSRKDAGFAFVQRGTLQIMLCALNDEWKTAPLDRPFGRGVNFQMTVEALEPIVVALSAAGWPLYREVEEKSYKVGADWSVCKEFLVQDPDGYLLRFSARA